MQPNACELEPVREIRERCEAGEIYRVIERALDCARSRTKRDRKWEPATVRLIRQTRTLYAGLAAVT